MKNIFFILLCLSFPISCTQQNDMPDWGERAEPYIVIWVKPIPQTDSVGFAIGGQDVKVEWGRDGAVSLAQDQRQIMKHRFHQRIATPIKISGYNLVSFDNVLNIPHYLPIDSITVGYCAAMTNLSVLVAKTGIIGKSLNLAYCPKLMNVSLIGINNASIDWYEQNYIKKLNVSYSELLELNLSTWNRLADLTAEGNARLTILKMPSTGILRTIKCSNNAIETLHLGYCKNLREVDLSANRLSSSQIDALFGALPTVASELESTINISSNVGAAKSNPSIAEAKGWGVIR